MSTLFEKVIRKDGKEYKIEFNFDDAAIMRDAATFEIKGSYRRIGDDEWVEKVLTIEARYTERVLVVLDPDGREIGRVSLELNLPESQEFSGEDLDIDNDTQMIEASLSEVGLEKLINLVPSDPIFGCLIKGAVSTAIGQIIRCWREVGEEGDFIERMSRVGGCLRDYGAKMLFTFMWRAGRCAATFGLA